MTRRHRFDRRGTLRDERGRRITGGHRPPADCVICERPLTVGVRTRRGMAHPSCAEGEQ